MFIAMDNHPAPASFGEAEKILTDASQLEFRFSEGHRIWFCTSINISLLTE
jgi:hypothetical protein